MRQLAKGAAHAAAVYAARVEPLGAPAPPPTARQQSAAADSTTMLGHNDQR
jgi:hypothetical protein